MAFEAQVQAAPSFCSAFGEFRGQWRPMAHAFWRNLDVWPKPTHHQFSIGSGRSR